MYEVDDRDRVVPVEGAPQSSPGAPIPIVMADSLVTMVAYYVHEPDPGWDGSTARMVGPDSSGEATAIVRFNGCRAHYFGAPNDETFSGHPLASRGLERYGTFEVRDSSWIRKLERMNSVHPQHSPRTFAAYRHLVFTFHDEVFECVCLDFAVVEVFRGSVHDAVPRMLNVLGGGPA